jgi:hypothetical protein
MSVRRLVRVLVLVAVVSGGAVTAPQPAAAHVDACAGLGTMAVAAPGLFYPPFAIPPAALGVVITLPTCTTTAGAFVAVGTISGWCGHAWGSAVAAGHFFVFVIEGGTMVLSGSVTGVIQVEPDPLAGSSCVTGAGAWLAQGAVALAP